LREGVEINAIIVVKAEKEIVSAHEQNGHLIRYNILRNRKIPNDPSLRRT